MCQSMRDEIFKGSCENKAKTDLTINLVVHHLTIQKKIFSNVPNYCKLILNILIFGPKPFFHIEELKKNRVFFHFLTLSMLDYRFAKGPNDAYSLVFTRIN